MRRSGSDDAFDEIQRACERGRIVRLEHLGDAMALGQVIDVLASRRRDAVAARAFFARALQLGPAPVEVTTDRAPVYPRVVDEAAPTARHVTEPYANNAIEADHGRLKARLRPMRGVKRLASARTIAAGHAFVQNLRRGHYPMTADMPMCDRIRIAFDQLAMAL
jgi:IS6 family transposase